jgi:hypothetical protein
VVAEFSSSALGNVMGWYRLDDRKKIKKVIELLFSNKTDLEIRMEEDENLYSSRPIGIRQRQIGEAPNELEDEYELVVQTIDPDIGNKRIQSASQIDLEFSISDTLFQCPVAFKGESTAFDTVGLILTFPKFLNIRDKRREERIPQEVPEFITVEFSLERGGKKGRFYELNVIDCSAHGLGLLVTERDMDLIGILDLGDKIEEITYYASSSMIKVEGTVVHKTKIHEGRYKGAYVVGIESPEIIENCTAK